MIINPEKATVGQLPLLSPHVDALGNGCVGFEFNDKSLKRWYTEMSYLCKISNLIVK